MRFWLICLAILTSAAAAQTPPGHDYAPLPKAPAGFHVRQITTMPSQPVKLASDGSGKWIDVLTIEGDVYRIDLPNGSPKKTIDHTSYCAAKDTQCIGMTFDRDGRRYVVENAFDLDARPQMNHVTIHRSASNEPAMKP